MCFKDGWKLSHSIGWTYSPPTHLAPALGDALSKTMAKEQGRVTEYSFKRSATFAFLGWNGSILEASCHTCRSPCFQEGYVEELQGPPAECLRWTRHKEGSHCGHSRPVKPPFKEEVGTELNCPFRQEKANKYLNNKRIHKKTWDISLTVR